MGNCRLDSNGKCRKSFFVRRSSRSLTNGISRSRCFLILHKPTYVLSFSPSFVHKSGSIGRQLLPIYSNFDGVAFGKSAGAIPKHHQIKTTWRSPNLFGVFKVLWTPNLDIVYFHSGWLFSLDSARILKAHGIGKLPLLFALHDCSHLCCTVIARAGLPRGVCLHRPWCIAGVILM